MVTRKILGPLLVIVIAACGGTEASNATSGAPAAAEGARPERIVSISTVAPEMLFAIDAGDRVVAVASMSASPADAPATASWPWTPCPTTPPKHRPPT